MKLAYWIATLIVLAVVTASFATGIYLMFVNRPTLEWTYNDILALRDVTAIGINRELHLWTAVLLPIAFLTYLVVSVTVTAHRRSLTKWRVAGLTFSVAALVLVGAAYFTGHYISTLFADHQTQRWAATQGSNMARSAPFLGTDDSAEHSFESPPNLESAGVPEFEREAAINRNYVLHCVALPTVFAALLLASIWILRPSKSVVEILGPTENVT